MELEGIFKVLTVYGPCLSVLVTIDVHRSSSIPGLQATMILQEPQHHFCLNIDATVTSNRAEFPSAILAMRVDLGFHPEQGALPDRIWQTTHCPKGLLVMVVPTIALGWIVVVSTPSAHPDTHLTHADSYSLLRLFAVQLYSALVVAARLTPTDPLICAAIFGLSALLPCSCTLPLPLYSPREIDYKYAL